MYIRECKVDGYGALRDVELVFDRPITVLLGPNEAGKSTLIRFIRAMLYGIPSRREPLDRAEPVFGGRHGGRIAVTATDGHEWLLERHADAGAGGPAGRKPRGGLTIRDADGRETGWSQSEWERRALGGVSERLFRQLFAVSLDELHALHTLQGEEIGNYLYHSGLAGGASLGRTRRRLAAEMDKLYRPRGATQEINRQLALIKELESEIRASRTGLETYRELEREWLQVGRRLEEVEKRRPALAARQAELRAAVDMREWWLKLRLLQEEERELTDSLADSARPPLTEEAEPAWRALQLRRREAQESVRQAESAVRQLREEREALRWDERLLEHAPELERLEAARQAVAARQEERESLAAERRLIGETLEELISRGGPDWTEDDLAAFVAVLSEREPLRRLQRDWEESRRRMASLETDASRLKRKREALLAERDAGAAAPEPAGSRPLPPEEPEAVGPLRPGDRLSLSRAWDELDDAFRLLERRLASAAEGADSGAAEAPAVGRSAAGRSFRRRKTGGSRALRFAAGCGAALSVALAIAGAATGASGSAAWYAAAAAAALLAGVFASIALRSRGNGNASRNGTAAERAAETAELRRGVEARLAALLERPEPTAAALLGGDRDASGEAWRRLRRAVQAGMAERERAERLRERLRESEDQLRQVDRELAALETAEEEEAARLERLEAEWAAWLSRWRLPPALTPESLPELLHVAEQGQSALRRQARTLERLTALEDLQSAFRQSAAALLRVCTPPPSMEDEPELAVSWLFRQAADHRALREEAVRADRQLRAAELAASEAKRRLEEAEAAIAAVLAQAGDPDEAAYERRLHVDERRLALRREIREAELRLEAGRSPEEAASMYRLLERYDGSRLEALLAQAEESREEAERERAELLDRRGRLSQELERLRTEAETEDRLMRLAEAQSRLESLSGRYALLAVADRLLQETKAFYDEQRQPEVLRLASRYFSEMTGRAYTRIIVPDDSTAVLAESADRRVTDSAFLSRGTQEQLYLAMRFALAEAASKEAPLPLLLDDLFVHFDEHRLGRTMPVLGEIARKRQVLLFTCHRHVAEAARQALPTAGFVSWEGRAAARSGASGPGPSNTASPG
jgi:uncharacterized protein YhaN